MRQVSGVLSQKRCLALHSAGHLKPATRHPNAGCMERKRLPCVSIYKGILG